MKTCEACGLPAPSTTLACALCATPFPTGPCSYRLEQEEDGYRWTTDGALAATAVLRDGTWDVRDAETAQVALTLIPVEVDGVTKVALVDHRARLVATFAPGGGETHGLGVVRDSYERILLVVRDDGPTGIHVIDAEGNVLALASGLPRGKAGLDVLVTSSGQPRSTTLVFGVGLAIQLLRVGHLRNAA